jgi:hypothetical protein
MDAHDFEICLGKTEDTPEVSRLLATLGVRKKLRPSKEEGYVNLEFPKLGLLLTFEPAEPKSSILLLSGIQYCADAEEGFTSFAGALPGGLTFSDSPNVVRRKLGKPSKIQKLDRQDHWIAGGRQLSVRYNKSLSGILDILQALSPDEDDEDDC